MNPDSGHEEIKKLLVENQRLLLENNQMLHKMRKTAIVGTIFRVIWFFFILGLPIYLYFSYIKPNMGNLMERYSELEQMTGEASSLKEWFESLKSEQAQ